MKSSCIRTLVVTAVLVGLGAFVFTRTDLTSDSNLGRNLPQTRQGDLVLDPPEIDLGVTRPGEQRECIVTLRNVSNHAIQLSEPTADCGCISLVKMSNQIIQPGDNAHLTFSVHAPASPGRIARHIEIASVESPSCRWRLDIDGAVSARVWSSPASVALELDRNGTARRRCVINHEDFSFQPEISAESSSIQIETAQRISAKSTGIEFTIASRVSGSATIDIFERITQTERTMVLRVPVTWRTRPDVKVEPESILISGDGRDRGEFRRRILITQAPEKRHFKIIARPEVPWSSVFLLRRLDSNTCEVILNLDMRAAPQMLPANFPLLSVSLDGLPDGAQVVSAVVRASAAP